jgi:hypothetical protein
VKPGAKGRGWTHFRHSGSCHTDEVAAGRLAALRAFAIPPPPAVCETVPSMVAVRFRTPGCAGVIV